MRENSHIVCAFNSIQSYSNYCNKYKALELVVKMLTSVLLSTHYLDR